MRLEKWSSSREMRVSLEERIGKIMYRTRRFKALNGAKGEYSRIVGKIAIYDENGNATNL